MEKENIQKTGGLRPPAVLNSTELTFFPFLILVRLVIAVIVTGEKQSKLCRSSTIIYLLYSEKSFHLCHVPVFQTEGLGSEAAGLSTINMHSCPQVQRLMAQAHVQTKSWGNKSSVILPNPIMCRLAQTIVLDLTDSIVTRRKRRK